MRAAALALASIAALTVACSDGANPLSSAQDADLSPAESALLTARNGGSNGYLRLTPESAALAVGDSLQLHAAAYRKSGKLLPGVSIIYRSGDKSIATVSTTGVVYGKGSGRTYVVAIGDGGFGADSVLLNVGSAGSEPAPDSGGTCPAGYTVPPGYETCQPSPSQPPSQPDTTTEPAPEPAPTPTPTPSPAPAPAPSPVSLPPGVAPNQPSGLTMLSNRPFNSIASTTSDVSGAEGWLAIGEGNSKPNLTRVADAGAPVSSSNVAQIKYPAGHPGGTGPAVMSLTVPNQPRELYVSTAMKLSSNFYGHPTSGVNKLMRFFCCKAPDGTASSGYFSAQGMGTGPLVPQLRLESIASKNRNLGPNLAPGTTLSRGVWHKVEVRLVLNTPGVADGIAQMWLDGTKIMEYRDVMWQAPGEANWHLVHITSIWGGGGSVVPADMYTWWDNAYVSYR